MSGASYTTEIWMSCKESDTRLAADRIGELLADGWQLHGGPIALPGERVLQALVKPAAAEREHHDGGLMLERGQAWQRLEQLEKAPAGGADRSWTDVMASGEQFGFAENRSRHVEPEQAADRARIAGEDAKP